MAYVREIPILRMPLKIEASGDPHIVPMNYHRNLRKSENSVTARLSLTKDIRESSGFEMYNTMKLCTAWIPAFKQLFYISEYNLEQEITRLGCDERLREYIGEERADMARNAYDKILANDFRSSVSGRGVLVPITYRDEVVNQDGQCLLSFTDFGAMLVERPQSKDVVVDDKQSER